ncbi:MAG: beta-ketoacyl-ACP synthase II [Deltaproteobacteria bacterium]|nr:beta-ketoacyl-ACP synthase II [Deltaproteobacteria bacterium]MBW2390644.1 beta-ketoacyl-ACP synthase II [Deltaproteobacteria bacterium]MBW2722788.1 beta-ketoacyl-ACP synthase II [Deltaproteobacteria bacterium]
MPASVTPATVPATQAQRVVVTGMGCVTPLGLDLPTTWDAACAGRSGVSSLTRFDASGSPARLAAQLPGDPEPQGVAPKDLRRMDPVVRYAHAAVDEALASSGLVIDDDNRGRIGVAIGTGIGGITTLLNNHDALVKGGQRRVSPFTIPMCISNMPAGSVSIQYRVQGPNLCFASACASGTHAIGESAALIARGQADVMLAGGAEAPIVGITVAGFAAMKALSVRNDDPEGASRPFDRGRDGFVLGEGAGIMVLESLEHARRRGAKIRAEILGFGASADGFHMVQPPSEGDGAVLCMEMALADAGIDACEIGYVNAHATSTPAGDPPEVHALRRVFGKAIDRVAVSATKSMTGHLLGAAGAVEGILTVRALETGRLPPTINLDDPDPECALDHVTEKARDAQITAALSNSFGFGGTNASLIFGVADG